MSEETGVADTDERSTDDRKLTPAQRVQVARAAFSALPMSERLKLVARYGAGAVALTLALRAGFRRVRSRR